MKNARWGLGLAILVPLATSVPLAQAPLIPKTGKGSAKLLVGTWRLTGVESRPASGTGEVTYPRGKSPTGYIIYDANGRMHVQIMNSAEVRPSRDGAGGMTMEQQAQAFRTYTAYFGTYTVDEDEGSVVHHIEGNVNPRSVGSNAKRFVEVTADRLALTFPSTGANGEPRMTSNLWARVK